MGYQAQATLTTDNTFIGRCYAVATQQAEVFKNDQRPEYVALAAAVMRMEQQITVFPRLNAAGPGIGDKVDNGDGTIDQSKVTDADLLSLTQANWPTVAALFPPPA